MVKKKTKNRRIKLSQQFAGGPAPSVPTIAPNKKPDLAKYSIGNDGRIPEAQTPFPAAFGQMSSGPNGNAQQAITPLESGMKAQLKGVGNSGTQIFGGYFSEEYLHDLRGRRGAYIWDEIRRSEAQVSMLQNAMINPIKAANWDVEPYDASYPEFVKHAELIKYCLFEQILWSSFLHEALTFWVFGYSLFEQIHNVVEHPKFGTINGLAALAFRSQKTIENWQLEIKSGKLLGVNQYTYSDLGGNQFIPGDFLLVLTLSKEGNNYEGISALRPMLGAYRRKDLYLKLAAIGVERYAIGTPIGTVPAGKEGTTEFEKFKELLQNYTSHEQSYIVKPQGWDIEIQKGEFDASKVKEMLVFENTEMITSVVANFLILGVHAAGGSLALGSNLSDFYTSGLYAYSGIITDGINKDVIPNLIKLNFGEQKGYPKLKCTGISDKAGKELSEVIKFLSDSRTLDPDKPLKEWLRKQYKMPKPDPTTAVAMPAIPAGASANYPKASNPAIDPVTGQPMPDSPTQKDGNPTNDKALLTESLRSIKLAESRYSKQFDKNKAKIKVLMKESLAEMYDGLKEALRAKYNSLSGANKILAATKVQMPGVNNYKAQLRTLLSGCAAQAVSQASKMVPKSRKKLDEYDNLSPAVRKLIDAQVALLADTQTADIEKISYFAFTSAASSSDDIDAILHEVDESVLPSLEGSTADGMSIDAAAGDVLAQVVNSSAMDFFDDAIDDIESFTFTNEDPVSEICQAMNGTTLAVGDPDLDTYATPLHHNCKSRWVPNLKGASDNPDIDRGGLSISKKALDSITLHDTTRYRLSEDSVRMKELTTKGREHIAKGNFAIPEEKKFPIHDISHARNALARAAGTEYEERVKKAVYEKYPSLKPTE